MAFIIARIVPAVVLFTVGTIIIKIIKTPDIAVARIFLVVLVMAQTSILCLFPVENLFISFPSAEKAFRYSNTGEIKAVIEGEHSDMVIGKRDDAYTYSVIPKTQEGWKICVGTDIKRVFYDYADGVSVEIYQHRSIDDFYVCASDTRGANFEIKDNVNSEFFSVESQGSALNETFDVYCAHINIDSGAYKLTVNGKTVAELDSLGGWFYEGRRVNRGKVWFDLFERIKLNFQDTPH